MKTIKREKYIQKIKPYIGKPLIKVLTGQRRVGKTTMLQQLIDTIKTDDKDANVIYINKELYDFKAIVKSDHLYNYVKNKTVNNVINYLLVDEVQEIEGFEIALRQLLAEQYDVYCTGSNAKMLSGDLATHLSGRYIEFKIHSLSYSEFLQFHDLSNSNQSLNNYIKFGGMPYLINLPLEEELVYGYLKSIFNTIILKDIVARYSIRDVDFIERLVYYLSDSLGSYVSSKKVSDFLKSQGIKLSINTVMNYLKYLSNSFFINKVQRYDIQGKKRFEINDKYFFSDLGLKHSVIPFQNNDIGKVFENLVYMYLIQNDYQVFVGKYHDKEIDFVANKNGQTKYIQVAYLLPDEKVREREFGNLLKLNDNFEKIVVSADEFTGDHKGVKHLNIRDLLIKKDG